MIQLIDRPTCSTKKTILCRHINTTGSVQIARLANLSCNDLEKVLFPGDRLVFKATSDAYLEIYTPEICSALLAERIWCPQLRCDSSVEP
ncbi:MAG: DUF1830 domain-containing protein [Thermosynechococcaceae cyanobacterium]